MLGNILINKLEKYGYIKNKIKGIYNLQIYNQETFEITESDFNEVISSEDLKIFSDIYIYFVCYNKLDKWYVNNFVKEYIMEINRVLAKILNLNAITDKEKDIFEKFLINSFIHGLDINKYRLTIKKYFDNYFIKNDTDYSYDRLALLTCLLANSVIMEFGDSCKIKLECSQTYNIRRIMESSIINKGNYILRFSDTIFLSRDEDLSQKEYNELLLFICCGILHESEHIRQFIKIFSGEKSKEIDTIKKEMILTNDTGFYTKYGMRFLSERQANIYAIENVTDYYHQIAVKKGEIEIAFLKKISNQIKKSLINNDKFDNVLSKEYDDFINKNQEVLEFANSVFESNDKISQKEKKGIV